MLHNSKYIFAGISVALIFAAAVISWNKIRPDFANRENSAEIPQKMVSPGSTVSDIGTRDPGNGGADFLDWKLYENQHYELAFKYPTGFSFEESARGYWEHKASTCQSVILRGRDWSREQKKFIRFVLCDAHADTTQFDLYAPSGLDYDGTEDLVIDGQAAKRYFIQGLYDVAYVISGPRRQRIDVAIHTVSVEQLVTEHDALLLEQILSTLQFLE
jgi:hypothetical protein